jgi:hypothetical protein
MVRACGATIFAGGVTGLGIEEEKEAGDMENVVVAAETAAEGIENSETEGLAG